MTRRTRIYLARKRVERYLTTPLATFYNSLIDDLSWYGMAGTRTYLDDSGRIKVERVPFAILNKIKEGEIVSDEYAIQFDNSIPYDMSQEVEKLKERFKSK